MQIYFDIVEKKRSKMHKILYVLLGLFFTILLISIIFDEGKKLPHISTLVILGLCIPLFVIIIIRSYVIKEFVKLGQIRFCENEIIVSIGTEITKFTVNELQSLRFVINETADDPTSIRSFINKEGIDNYIEMIDSIGRTHQFRIFIEGITTLRILDRFLKNWKFEKYILNGSRSISNY